MQTLMGIINTPPIAIASGPYISATGGTIIYDGNFKVHVFEANDVFTIFSATTQTIDYVIVGGGGGGEANSGSGGKPGGTRGQFNYITSTSISVGAYPVVVGAAGIGRAVDGSGNTTRTPTNGGNSSFNGTTSNGGIFGGSTNTAGTTNGVTGASFTYAEDGPTGTGNGFILQYGDGGMGSWRGVSGSQSAQSGSVGCVIVRYRYRADVAVWGAGDTLNTTPGTENNSNITLSGANLIATVSDAASLWRSVRGTTGISSGRKAFEVPVNSTGPVRVTLDPSAKGSAATLSNENLSSKSTVWTASVVKATVGKSSGKWYWEVITTVGSGAEVSIATAAAPLTGDASGTGFITYWGSDGKKYINSGTGATYGATFTTGDMIGVALDMDGGTITMYKNGTTQGTMATGLTGTYYPTVSAGVNSLTEITINMGEKPFSYSPPSGYIAINQSSVSIGVSTTALNCSVSNAKVGTGEATGAGYNPYAYKERDGGKAQYGNTYITSDIIGCVYDADNGIVEYYKNGYPQYQAFGAGFSGTYFPTLSLKDSGTDPQMTINFGGTAFTYSYAANTYATLDFYNRGTRAEPSNNNLTTYCSTATGTGIRSTIGKTSGKWYWEVKMTAWTTNRSVIGITNAASSMAAVVYLGGDATQNCGYYGDNGQLYYSSAGHAFGAAFNIGDVIGIVLNATTRTAAIYKNDVLQGTTIALSGTDAIYAALSNSGGPGNATLDINFGQKSFIYPNRPITDGANFGLY